MARFGQSLNFVLLSCDFLSAPVSAPVFWYCNPETADPGSASGDIELSIPQGGTTNKVAKVNSYGSFGLGVELGTWR